MDWLWQIICLRRHIIVTFNKLKKLNKNIGNAAKLEYSESKHMKVWASLLLKISKATLIACTWYILKPNKFLTSNYIFLLNSSLKDWVHMLVFVAKVPKNYCPNELWNHRCGEDKPKLKFNDLCQHNEIKLGLIAN